MSEEKKGQDGLGWYDAPSWVENAAKINVKGKQIVAVHVVSHLVNFGDVIQIGAGTSLLYLMEELLAIQRRTESYELVILTTSLDVLEKGLEATERDQNKFGAMQLILTGGTLYAPTRSFIGKQASLAIKTKTIRPNLVCFGVDGICFSEKKGISITYHFDGERETQLALATRPTEHRVIICDYTKFGKGKGWPSSITTANMLVSAKRCTIITNAPDPEDNSISSRDVEIFGEQVEKFRKFLKLSASQDNFPSKELGLRIIDNRGAVSEEILLSSFRRRRSAKKSPKVV